MNDPFAERDRDDDIAQKLTQIAGQTHASGQFAAELEARLRSARKAKPGWVLAFQQVSPVLRWAALMIALVLVLSLSIKTLIRVPQPAANGTPGLPDVMTPTPQVPDAAPTAATTGEEGYDWRGSKLFLAEPLPESPSEANVYLLQPDQPATPEEARALAQRFGIEGDVYEAPGELPNTAGYMVSDGRQRLYVRSKNYFTYYAEYSTNTVLLGARDLSDEEAQVAIDSFLKSHGFEFDYQIQKEDSVPGQYYVIRLTPDGRAIRFDYNMPSRLGITLGSDRQVIYLDSSQIDYEVVGVYGIRSAEEAFQQVLGNAEVIQNGVVESGRSGGVWNESYWERSYPDDQTVTIYGRVTIFDSLDPSRPPFVAINSYTATGNTPPASNDQLIEATGQFHTRNGIRTFHVESWKLTEATETAVMGTLA